MCTSASEYFSRCSFSSRIKKRKKEARFTFERQRWIFIGMVIRARPSWARFFHRGSTEQWRGCSVRDRFSEKSIPPGWNIFEIDARSNFFLFFRFFSFCSKNLVVSFPFKLYSVWFFATMESIYVGVSTFFALDSLQGVIWRYEGIVRASLRVVGQYLLIVRDVSAGDFL